MSRSSEQDWVGGQRKRNFAISSACLYILFSLAPQAALANDELFLPPGGGSGVALSMSSEIDELMIGLTAVDENELSESRGGESAAVSIQDLNSNVEGNSISGTVTTGSVSIGENAFSDLDGISSVIVNSGNNVSIQSSTVINVVISE